MFLVTLLSVSVSLCSRCVSLGENGQTLGSQAINQKVVGSIPGRAKCVLGQGT